MISIKKKEDCCGCTACANACPVNAISMKTDEEGFLYPDVNTQICIGCNKCESVCPIEDNKIDSELLEAYVTQHKNDEILYHSASGGAFSAIGQIVINQGGVVYGVGYNHNMVVMHSKAENTQELIKFRSSKYVQSYQDMIFKDIKANLLEDRWVCYSGTPCQVAGLKRFLGKDYSKLITVDVVCKGVSSPEVLRQFVELLENKYNSKIVGINFKRKTYGYHSSTMSVDFANGKTYSCGGITDPMMRSFRANICLRPSCSNCRFKGANRVSDLTIFDCWHYANLSGNKDNDKGHTAILVHSNKGKKLLSSCENLMVIEPIDVKAVIDFDGVMINGLVKPHILRNEYMHILKEKGLMEAINLTIPISAGDRLKDNAKKYLYRLRLLNIAKRMARKR